MPIQQSGVIVFFGSRRLAAGLFLSAVAVTACGSSASSKSSSSEASSSASSSGSKGAVVGPKITITSAVGVKVTGGFGTTPNVSVPVAPAPSTLTQQVLTVGTGAVVAKGDTLIANYVGQTWAPSSGKVNVFDSSFSRGRPAAFLIGVGQVIAGWDTTLVGKQLGSRVLLTIPPADGYGTAGQSEANISGTDTLVFVIDLVAAYKPDASAPGTVVSNIPTVGLPKITNVPGQEPKILSTAGVPIPTTPQSTLVVSGTGPKIDSSKSLVLQLVETDLATATMTQSSWGQAPQTDAASSVLGIADKLSGQNIGSRVIVLLPAVDATPATATEAAQPAVAPQVLIVDVIGQF
jgi:peptidylprolyl isomerase